MDLDIYLELSKRELELKTLGTYHTGNRNLRTVTGQGAIVRYLVIDG